MGIELVVTKHSKEMVDTTCDPLDPSVVLGPETYTHLHQKGILFHSNAIWALPIVYVDDEYRLEYSIIVQKLLWLIDSHVKVKTGQHLDSYSNRTNTDDLVANLKTFSCPQTAANLSQCFAVLFKDLSKNITSISRSPPVLPDWFSLLSKLGYQFPNIRGNTHNRTCLRNTLRRLVGNKSSVTLNVNKTSQPRQARSNAYVSQNLLHDVCSATKTSSGNSTGSRHG